MMTETEKTRKLTLEEYVRFFEGRDQKSFSSVQLNQIFTMHAFVQPRSVKVMVEALKWIDLMLPARSTVRDPRTYPCAALSLDEVRDDIAALGWKECPIGSLAAALGSSRDDIAAVGWQECPIDSEAVEESTALISFGSPTEVIALSDATAGTGKKRKRPRRTRFPPASEPAYVALVGQCGPHSVSFTD